MKHVIKLKIAFALIIFIALYINIKANCSNPSGVPANGHCNRDDICNKFCQSSGTPKDCVLPPPVAYN